MLWEILEKFVSVYIDDILTYSPDFFSHITNVKQVLKALLEAGLVVKAESACFTPIHFWAQKIGQNIQLLIVLTTKLVRTNAIPRPPVPPFAGLLLLQ